MGQLILSRSDDWPEKLAAYIAAAGQSKFVWGKSDCAFFAGNWVLLISSVDPLAAYRGRYHSERGALRVLRRIDGTLAQAMTARFGEPISTRRARRGDVVLKKTDDILGQALGICLGVDAAFRRPDTGIERIAMAETAAAWAVG